jgi:hypothetical protein
MEPSEHHQATGVGLLVQGVDLVFEGVDAVVLLIHRRSLLYRGSGKGRATETGNGASVVG